MPTYKLTYFNVRARAELTRLLFAASGTKYEDIRITSEEWKKMKDKTPQGQLPILDVDGVIIPQSNAIARYVARQVGLMGGNDLEQAQADVILETCSEMRTKFIAAFFEKDETKKAELVKKNKEEVIPRYLDIFQKVLDSNSGGNGFFVGKSVTIADLAVMDALENSLKSDPNLFDKFPKLKLNRKIVTELPKVKPWLESRPESEF